MLALCGQTWWRKPENPGKTTEPGRATTTLPHALTRIRTRIAVVTSECVIHYAIQAPLYSHITFYQIVRNELGVIIICLSAFTKFVGLVGIIVILIHCPMRLLRGSRVSPDCGLSAQANLFVYVTYGRYQAYVDLLHELIDYSTPKSQY